MRAQQAKKKPFYAALFLYTPHWPMEAPEKYVAKYADNGRAIAFIPDPLMTFPVPKF